MKDSITQDELKAILHYDSSTGIFTRLKGRGTGKVAGSLNKVKGYYYLRAAGNRYMLHRLAWLYMTGTHPDGQIDHIDRDKGNNRIDNLRVVTASTNQRNRPLNYNNSSSVNGIYFNGTSWVAQITINSVVTYIGSYKSLDDAAAARNSFNVKENFSDTHGK